MSKIKSIYILVFFSILLILSNQAKATNEIVCTSKQFNVSLAVGSDGYVASMVLTNTSAIYFSEALEITTLGKRQVTIANKSVNIEATLEIKKVSKVRILLRRGKGYISVDTHREKMTCDWTT